MVGHGDPEVEGERAAMRPVASKGRSKGEAPYRSFSLHGR